MDTTPIYRKFLQTSLASVSDMNSGQVEAITEKFDKIASKSSPELAFTVTLAAYGDEDERTAVASVKEFIQKNLEQLSKQHKGITKGDRLKALIERFNKNLDLCSGLSVNGITLDKEQLEAVKVNMPHCMQATQLTSIASTKNSKNRGCEKLVFEIRY